MNTNASRIASAAMVIARRSGLAQSSAARVTTALTWLDPERVSGIPGLINGFGARVEAIRRNIELSDEGKRNQVAAAASSTLGNLASIARKVAALEAEHRAERDTAVPLPEPSIHDTLVDLALAAHVRAADPIPSVAANMSERARIAIARMPIELSGLTAATQTRVRTSLMDPAIAVRLGEEEEALGHTRAAVQAALDQLQADARWTPAELVNGFGKDWKLPGVVSSLANRLAAESDGQASE